MGNPLDPESGEYEFGINCPNCWGLGKPFGDTDTPQYVKVVFSGIEAGAPLAAIWKGTYLLKQKAPAGCIWEFKGSGLTCVYRLGAPLNFSELFLAEDGVGAYFQDTSVIFGCKTHFINTLTVPPAFSENGEGFVTWGPGINENQYNQQWGL